MPSRTLGDLADRYVPGTTLEVFVRAAWTTPGRRPSGSAVDSGAVSSAGAVTFTDLDADSAYVAGADVAGVWQGVTFQTDPDPRLALATIGDMQDAIDATTLGPVGQRLMGRLEHDTADATMLVLSDSTGNDVDEWPYLVALELAARYPHFTVKYALWNDAGHAYPALSTLQAGTGTHTLTIYNCSISSRFFDYQSAPYFDTMVAATLPDLVFVSHGHNAGTSQPVDWQFRDMALAFNELVTLTCPLAEVVWIAENADAAGSNNAPSMAIWPRVLAQVAALRGTGFIDAWQAFTDASVGGVPVVDPAGDALILNDGNFVHPNEAGSELWADLVLAHLTPSRHFQPRPQAQSSLLDPLPTNLIAGDWADYAAGTPDGWAQSGCTLGQDAVNFESPNGYALRVQSAGAAPARLFYSLSAAVLRRVKGRPICFAVRLRSKSGTAANAAGGQGRVRIVSDGTGGFTNTSFGSIYGLDGFRWVTISAARIPIDATDVSVNIYADTGNAGDGDITVDRAVLAHGILPRDIV